MIDELLCILEKCSLVVFMVVVEAIVDHCDQLVLVNLVQNLSLLLLSIVIDTFTEVLCFLVLKRLLVQTNLLPRVDST